MAKLFVSNKDESVRMFDSDILDSVSRIHWTVPLIIYVPVILIFLGLSIFSYEMAALSIALLYICGIFTWTFVEYILHRFAFHYQPKTEWGKRFHFMFHGVHHDYPNDSKRLVMVPSVSIPLAALFYGIFWLILGTETTAPFFAGFVSGYLAYDMIHYATHHNPAKNKLFLKIKHHHMKHHFKEPDKGYGVSQPLWDYVFGTNYPKKWEK